MGGMSTLRRFHLKKALSRNPKTCLEMSEGRHFGNCLQVEIQSCIFYTGIVLL